MPVVATRGAASSQGFGQFGNTGGGGSSLYVWGGNFYGEALQGLAAYQSSPILASYLSDYAVISRGYAVQAYIKSNGTLWVTGYNTYGITGDNTTSASTVYSPVQVGTATNWASVACGTYNWIAIKTDNTMWACGYNAYSTLGTNDSIARSSPVQIGLGTAWSKISMAYYDAYAINTSNQLYAWGYNFYGELGNNNTAQTSSPVQIGSASDWTQIKAQQYTVLGLRGTALYVWGEGANGQIGDGTATYRSSPVQIAGTWSKIGSADYTSYGIRTDGTLWVWGNNSYGELGQNTSTNNRSSPIQVGTANDWADLANGYYGVVALKTNGSVWNWGYGGNGNLGNLSITDVSSPIQVGVYTSPTLIQGCNYAYVLVKESTGNGYGWGYGAFGNILPQFYGYTSPTLNTNVKKAYSSVILGYGAFTGISKSGKYYTAVQYNIFGAAGNNSTVSQLSPVLSGYSKVLVTLYNSLALKSDGTLWAWGYNATGAVGQNNVINYSSPVQIGTDTNWTDIQIGTPYVCYAKKSTGTLWAWGTNAPHGTLGINDTGNRSSPTQVGPDTDWGEIYSGYYATWAFRGGTLYRWGYNGYGQLGTNDVINYSSPVAISGTYTKVVTGLNSSHLLKSNGTLWACGIGAYGVLGQNDIVDRSSPVQIGSDTNWNSILATAYTITATKSNGTLWGWGYNIYGQVGDGTFINKSSPVQIGIGVTWKSTTQQPGYPGYVTSALA